MKKIGVDFRFMKNLFDVVNPNPEKELVLPLYENGSVRIEHIVSDGHASPDGFWYDQDDDEWVCVLKGEARLRFEDSEVLMRAGDQLLICAHRRHRVDYVSVDCRWLAVFSRCL